MAFRNFIYSTTQNALTKAIAANTVTNDDIAFVNENGVMFIQTLGVKFPCGYSKSEADSRYLQLTGGNMIGDIYCVGNKMYSTKYTYNFNSYTELDFSDTETITYNGFTSKRMILRNGNSSVTTHIYGNDTWIINSTPQFVTYANGPRPLFVRNENQALPMKGDKITIVGSRITGSTLIAVDKSDSTLEITQTTLTSGKISATVMFTTNPTTDLPIFLDLSSYIDSLSYSSNREGTGVIFLDPTGYISGRIYGSIDANKNRTLNISTGYTLNVVGAALFNNNVTANKFIKSGSSDSYFLLGGGGTTAISNYSKSDHTHTSLVQSYATDETLSASSTVLTALYAAGSNKYKNNPEPSNGFGVIKLRTASGYYGDIMLTHVGNLYTRSSNVLDNAAWRRVIDSEGGTISGSLNVTNTLTANKSNFTDVIGAASGIRCGLEDDEDNLIIDGTGLLSYKVNGKEDYALLCATGFSSGTTADGFDLLNDSLSLRASFGDTSKYWYANYGVDSFDFTEFTKSSSSSSYNSINLIHLAPEFASGVNITDSRLSLTTDCGVDGGYSGYLANGDEVSNNDIPISSFNIDCMGYNIWNRQGSGTSAKNVSEATYDQYGAVVGKTKDPSDSNIVLEDYGFGFFSEYQSSDSFVGLTPTGVKLYGGSSSKILVSDGTMNTLKTVNGESLLGSGDVSHTFHFDAYNTTVTPTIATSIPVTATDIKTGGVTFYTKVNKFLVSVSYNNNNVGYNALFNLKDGYPVNNLNSTIAGTQRVASKYPHNMYAKYPDVYICTGTSITYYCNGSGSSAAALVQTQVPSVAKLSTARTVSGGVDIVTSFKYDGSADSTATVGYYSTTCVNTTTNNYPWHRIATFKSSAAYIDAASLIRIYIGRVSGYFGLVHVGCRTNSTTSTGSVSSATATWLMSNKLALDSIKIGLYNVGGATYADVFFKTPAVTSTYTFDFISNKCLLQSKQMWTAVKSTEAADTTTTDKKSSYECWKTIEEAAEELHGQAYTNIITASYTSKTLADSGISDGVNAITTTGSGNAVTAVSVSNHTLTATKGTSFLPSTGGTLSGDLTIDSGKQITFAGSGGNISEGTANPGDISINGGCVIDLDGLVNTSTVLLGSSSLDGDILVWYNGKHYQLNFAKLLSLGCLTAV